MGAGANRSSARTRWLASSSGTRSSPRGTAEPRSRASASSNGSIAGLLALFVAVVAAVTLGERRGVGQRRGEERLHAKADSLEAARKGRDHDAVDNACSGPGQDRVRA